MILEFKILKDLYTIYRFRKDSIVPDWIYDSEFYSVTRTQDELSIICKNSDIAAGPDVKLDKLWRILKITGPLDLFLIGIIADISSRLKESKIPIFIISTFDTDYILVKDHDLDKTITVLKDSGHKIN